MVMEEVPNPQCVGREFVRQYYTMLNKAPVQMHRFYSKTSSFVHSGIDSPGKDVTPVFGQEHIHQAILKLNFSDCHAKIRRVDSHATLANGVVVQVSGELSNSGQPMRRFMQTFVLAPLAPKNYYVHNDIFRYQDEVFSDDETGDEGVGGQAEHETEPKLPEPTPSEEPVATLNSSSSMGSVTNTWNTSTWPTEMNGTASGEESISHHVDSPTLTKSPTIPDPVVDDPIPTPPSEPNMSYEETQLTQPTDTVDKPYEASDYVVSDYSINEMPPHMDLSSNDGLSSSGGMKKSNEKKTYATIVNKGADSVSPGPTHVQPPRVDNFPNPNRRPRPLQQQRSTGGGGGGSNFRSDRPRYSDQYKSPLPPTTGDFMPMEPPRRSNFDDKNQLFVGNVPHNVSEDDLRNLFKVYGHIVDLHMNTKPQSRAGSGARAANFAFVMFDDPKAAQKVLDDRPIMFQNVGLNVEEKKSRKMGYGDNRMGGGGGGGGRGGPPRGGPNMRPPRSNRFAHQK